MEEYVKIIIGVVSGVVMLASAIVGIIIKTTKNKRLKEFLEKSEFWLSKVKTYVSEAEKLANTPGTEKKQFVVSMVEKIASDNKLSIDKKQISDMIESAVSVLNSKKKNEAIQN